MVALKTTWIRRLLHSSLKWIRILEAKISTHVSNIWSRRTNNPLRKSKRIHDSFWKEVVLS